MSNVKCLVALVLVLGLVTPCFADDATKIVGIWRRT
jgi:hypothetical protein